MKVFSLVLIFFAINANAQFSASLTGGIDYGSLLTNLLPEPHRSDEAEHFHYRHFFHYGFKFKYDFKEFGINTGFLISDRGTKEVGLFVSPNGNDRYDIYYTYWVVPLHISKYYYGEKFEVGGGVNYTYRAGENNVTEADQNETHGMDVQVFVKYNILKRLSVDVSYLLGGVDKYIGNKKGNYMHSLFGLSLTWDFVKLKRKS